MPATANIEVAGVREVVKALREVDPELKKQFVRDAKGVVAPMVAEVKALYPALPLSGMARSWTPKAFSIFPWQQSKVRRSVKVKTSTRRDKNSVVYVSQGDPAGVLFETVSRNKPLGANIRARSERVLWPTADRHLPQITQGIDKIVREAEKVVQGMVN